MALLRSSRDNSLLSCPLSHDKISGKKTTLKNRNKKEALVNLTFEVVVSLGKS
ncbi:hypothetical protein MOUN0_M06326 [Monosporozyma unispora]